MIDSFYILFIIFNISLSFRLSLCAPCSSAPGTRFDEPYFFSDNMAEVAELCIRGSSTSQSKPASSSSNCSA